MSKYVVTTQRRQSSRDLFSFFDFLDRQSTSFDAEKDAIEYGNRAASQGYEVQIYKLVFATEKPQVVQNKLLPVG